jgi:putative aldouronate transport system permease protein
MLFDGMNIFLLTMIMIAVIYPFVYVFSTSVSEQSKIAEGAVKLFPVGFNIEAYNVCAQTQDR